MAEEEGSGAPEVPGERKLSKQLATRRPSKQHIVEQAPKVDEEARWRMDPDFFYDLESPDLNRGLEENELPKEAHVPARFLGIDFHRHYNLMWVSAEEVAYITGHVICFMNVGTNQRRYLHGRDDGGVGAIALSDDGEYFAVAERSFSEKPNVYIYTFKDMKLYRILRKGTEKGFAAVKFSPHQKNHLAALGCAPDYLLTVWDWTNERLLLKCKAYGQDVYDIRWGQFPGMLTSVGSGHIRFWKMALTFTGLKLQGDIGKFGATELSDILGYVELPDGKVVTGTEYGRLLLWEGVFVKVELMRGSEADPRKIESLPHEKAIDVLFLDKEDGCIVSGGDDGFLRWWPIEDTDEAEADYDLGILEYGISMRHEVRIPPIGEEFDHFAPAHIHHVSRNADNSIWLIQDTRNGIVWRYEKDHDVCIPMLQSHSGPVTGSLLMPLHSGLMVSGGLDGTIRTYNVTADKDHEIFLDRRPGVGVTCLSAVPTPADPHRRTICAGYTDGTIRVMVVCKDGFVLAQALKPHTAPVRQIAYSEDGKLMATLGADNNVFFFRVQGLEEHAVPIGFVVIPCQINSFSWHPDIGRILLSLQDGTLLELMKPIVDDIDNTESYHIKLDYRTVVPEIPEPEESEDEEEEEDEENEGGDGAEGGEIDPLAALTGGEDDGEGKKKKKKKKEEEKKQAEDEDDDEHGKEVVPNTISKATYIQDDGTDRVFFVGTGTYTGGLWECSLEPGDIQSIEKAPLESRTPAPSMSILRKKLPKGVVVTHLSISPSGRFLFVGFVDGRLWILPVNNTNVHSCISVADSIAGAVMTVFADEAERMLVIGAADGTLSALQWNAEESHVAAGRLLNERDLNMKEIAETMTGSMPEIIPADVEEDWDLPSCENPGFCSFARDISDPNQYSIQDAKLKTEQDHAKAQAEQKKTRVRERVLEVRTELEELQAKNQQIPNNKLSMAELSIDQEYLSFLAKDMERQIEDVNFELAWSVEFHERGLQKLRDHFLSRVDFERIEVLGFRSPHRVSTFRTPAMSQELQSALGRLHELIFSADRDSDNEHDNENDLGSPTGRSEGGLRGTLRFDGEDGIQSVHGGRSTAAGTNGPNGTGEAPITGAAQRELRRQLRQERKQAMQELEQAKPSDGYEDPQDVEAIAHAEATLGNYQLKTSDNYQVPESQRMNAEKKRRQMFLLEESMHAIKTEFNQRVLALRDFRQQARAEVQRDLMALNEINQQLGTTSDWVRGLLDDPLDAPPEFPEKRFNYSEEELKAFQEKLQGPPPDAAAAPEASRPELQLESPEPMDEEDIESEDGDPDLEEESEEERAESDDALAASEPTTPKKRSSREDSEPQAAQPPPPLTGRAALAAKRIARLAQRAQLLQQRGEEADALGKSVYEEAQARLWHDRAQLEEHIKQVIDTFNEAVASIEKERAKLESDLKNADLKLLVLHEELLALNELEEKDDALLKKAKRCREEKAGILQEIKGCQEELEKRKEDVAKWHSEEQCLQGEFTKVVGENSPFLGALLKIYKKKVKRKKGKKDDEDFDEDEDEEEEESEMESDEEDDDVEDESGPPTGCDIQVFEEVLDLREKRLDMEENLVAIQKEVEDLKRRHKKLLDDERRIDKEQKQTDSEIQQFQTDKQKKLNQVEILFTLQLSQVQCLAQDDSSHERLPPELNRHVVFTAEELRRLRGRITELHQEVREVSSGYKQLQRDFKVRKKEKNQAAVQIEELQTKFQDIQMLKFGQIVNLDLIERSAPDKYVQELRDKVAEEEVAHRKKLTEWEKRIEKQKKELAKATCENTSLMEQIVSMGYSQIQLDSALNARIANVTVNDNEPLIELRELEQERMKDWLAVQTKEIATLKAEINLFRKKGGHIYTTVTANRAATGR